MRQLSKTGLESRWAVELEGGGEKQDQSLLSWEIEKQQGKELTKFQHSTFNIQRVIDHSVRNDDGTGGGRTA
jgi:hypothetical protein